MKKRSHVLVSFLKSLVIAGPIIGFLIGSFLVLDIFDNNASNDSAICNSGIDKSTLRALMMGSVSYDTALVYVDYMDDYGSQFDIGDLIQKESVIAVDLGENVDREWREYPVIPILNYEGVGIFYVMRDFQVEASGTCFFIR